jgi:hypothetical protein
MAELNWQDTVNCSRGLPLSCDDPNCTKCFQALTTWEVAYKAGQKAGRQEVVDWVEAIGNWGHIFKVARWSWEAKLKEWGIV